MGENQEETKNEQIINTEAAKAKAAEVAGNVKEGASKLIERVKTDKNLQTIIIAVVGVIAVLLVAIILGSILGGPKKVAKSYINGFYMDHDAKKVCKTFPKEMIEEEYDDIDECIEGLEETFEYLEELTEDDDDQEIKKYEFKNKKVLDKDSDDFEDIVEYLEDDYDIPEKKVKKIVRYSVKLVAKDKEYSKSYYVYVAKIKGHWRFVNLELK